MHKKHPWMLVGAMITIVSGILGLSLSTRNAHALAPDENFRVAIPYFGSATQGTDVYLEISQPGSNNTLDAPEAWAKIYIEPSRINNTTIGIYRGGYANGVDSQGTNFQGQGEKFLDDRSTNFEFKYGIELPNGEFTDEVPCPDSFATKNSADISSTGWYKIDMSRFSRGKCRSLRWGASAKSGRYVVFVKASWRVKPNPIADGRLNAFKISAAYENSADLLDNPLTGYWSNYSVATSARLPGAAAYTVQDRKSQDGTRGDYTFRFAPDCRIARGTVDTTQRYLHWKDVDYPGYYNDGGLAPSFDVVEISPTGARRTMPEMHVDSGTVINGNPAFGQNRHAALPFRGKGGYRYEWVWHNITRVDGVSFWLPYDDYPSLVGGCGNYKYNVDLKAGTATTPAVSRNTEFKVAGGQTVSANLTPSWSGQDAGSDIVTDLYLSPDNGRSIDSAFVPQTPTVGGSTIVENTFLGKRYHTTWNLPRQGPRPTYTPSRSDLYANFKVKDDAPDGARYCFTASITPTSNNDGGPKKSSPESICFTIDNSLKPFLKTAGGDVHAGDGGCTVSGTTIPSNGKIIGQNNGSLGSYVVSANNKVTNFGSGGVTNGTGLSFGKTGYYGPLCRPGLGVLQAELSKSDARTIPVTGPSYSLTSDLARESGNKFIVTSDHDIRIIGTSSRPVTINAPNNTVTISGGNFGSNTGAPSTRAGLPTVGVIAKNIKIEQSTIGIIASLYATGKIDTCSDRTVEACRSALILSGFAMAKEFRFARSSTGTNGLQLAELLSFSAAFYLNPPPGFGSAAGAVQYLGERAPLY